MAFDPILLGPMRFLGAHLGLEVKKGLLQDEELFLEGIPMP